ncbi:MAG: glycosyltransferase [Candidatus Zixiibacteriota bacterium]|nr:MAG: glycosyltransferase [candidate division Zixibacteria bacterium]
MISVIIPHYGPRELLAQCLRTLPDDVEVVVADNNGPAWYDREGQIAVEEVRDGNRLTLYFHAGEYVNLGFARAVNEAVKRSSGDYLLLLNNDCELPEWALDWMLDILKQDDQIAVVGPLSTAHTHWQWVHGVANWLKRNLPAGDYITTRTHNFPADTVTFWCALIPRRVWDDVGPLDERFFMYYEDNDWCRRAREKGYELALDLGTVVTHHHQSEVRPEVKRYMAESLRRYNEKWGEQKPASVMIAVLNEGWVRKEIGISLLSILSRPRSGIGRIQVIWPSERPVSANRNYAVQQMLQDDFDYLLMWDDDQACQYDPLDLVEYDKDIIGLPTPIYRSADNPDKPITLNVNDLQPEGGWRTKALEPNMGLVEVDMVGTGMMLVARRVFEHPEMRPAFMEIFDENGLVELSEDYNFCLRAKRAGFRVWTHTGYSSEHWSTIPLLQATRQINHVV